MTDPALIRRVTNDAIAAVARDHPRDKDAIFAALLIEILANGLYSDDPTAGPGFAAALNGQLAALAERYGTLWQLMRVRPAAGDPPPRAAPH